MAAVNGDDIVIRWNGSQLTGQVNGSLTLEQEMINILSQNNNNFDSFLPRRRRWSVQCEIVFQGSYTILSELVSTAKTRKYITFGKDGVYYWAGYGYIVNAQLVAANNDRVTISCEIKGDGALSSVVTPAPVDPTWSIYFLTHFEPADMVQPLPGYYVPDLEKLNMSFDGNLSANSFLYDGSTVWTIRQYDGLSVSPVSLNNTVLLQIPCVVGSKYRVALSIVDMPNTFGLPDGAYPEIYVYIAGIAEKILQGGTFPVVVTSSELVADQNFIYIYFAPFSGIPGYSDIQLDYIKVEVYE